MSNKGNFQSDETFCRAIEKYAYQHGEYKSYSAITPFLSAVQDREKSVEKIMQALDGEHFKEILSYFETRPKTDKPAQRILHTLYDIMGEETEQAYAESLNEPSKSKTSTYKAIVTTHGTYRNEKDNYDLFNGCEMQVKQEFTVQAQNVEQAKKKVYEQWWSLSFLTSDYINDTGYEIDEIKRIKEKNKEIDR